MNTKNTKKRNKNRDRNDENEFTVGGKRYVARIFNPCKGCVFLNERCLMLARPPCYWEHRKDGRDVVFVLKETEE